MNDRHDGYADGEPYEESYDIVGYDEFGRPVYGQASAAHRPAQGTSRGSQGSPGSQGPQQGQGQGSPGAPGYDPYGTPAQPQHQPQGYGYDPYAAGSPGRMPPSYGTGQQQPPAPGYGSYDPYGTPEPAAYNPYGQAPSSPQQARVAGQTAYIPQQTSPAPGGHTEAPAEGFTEDGSGASGGSGGSGAQGVPGAPGGPGVPGPPGVPPGSGRRSGAGRGRWSGGGRPDGARPAGDDGAGGAAGSGAEGAGAAVGGAGAVGADGEPAYQTEQFAFVEEPDGDSEDVIDWLKFTENRTERREEAKRRARSRIIALVAVLAVAVVGGAGYLWYAGKLPGSATAATAAGTTTAAGAQNRDVIVVHLHDTAGGGTSTALLVNNTTTKQGATVLLPNSLVLTGDDGTATTLAKSVADDGSSGTSDEIDSVLGTDIEGTWRLDTPYLDNLVELVGDIEVDTNAAVPDPDDTKKGAEPLVKKGSDQTLSGKMAVAYATYRASGESEDAQLQRFGQVMQGVLRKMSSDAGLATTTVQTLAQILDPSLTDKDLGTFLAKLADHAKDGDYKTELLPVQSDGAISAQATDSVVKPLLGGTVKNSEAGSAVRVGIKDATGSTDTAEKARVALVNGGYTTVDSGTTTAQTTSQVVYTDAADKENATEVAKTLGLSTSTVQKGQTTSNADVSVTLGTDYRPSTS